MKTLKILIAIILLASCSPNKPDVPTDLAKMKLAGNVKAIHTFNYQVDEKSYENSASESWRNLIGGSIKYFNNNGFLTETRQLDSTGSVETKSIYLFDDLGIAYLVNTYDSEGTLTSYDSITYDERFNEIERTRYTADGKFDHKNMSTYNNRNQEVEFLNYDSPGWLEAKETYEYDNSGNMITKKWYYSDGRLLKTWTYKHDSLGNVIYVETRALSGSDREIHSVYEFDSSGNWINQAVVENEVMIGFIERTFEYYSTDIHK